MDPNQDEIPNLPEKEFRRSVIKLSKGAPCLEVPCLQVKSNLRKSKKRIQEMTGEIFSETDNINKKQSKLQKIMDAVRETQNALESLSNKIEQVEENSSELEDKAFESSHSNTDKEKRISYSQQTHEKMLIITGHQRNANQNHNEIPSHTS